jgi:hypothetical protein
VIQKIEPSFQIYVRLFRSILFYHMKIILAVAGRIQQGQQKQGYPKSLGPQTQY